MTDSIYDQLNASGTVAKQRVVETFSGDALDTDRWNENESNGTNTFGMADSVDGGYTMTADATLNANPTLGYATSAGGSGKRQFALNGSVCIWVAKRNTASSTQKITTTAIGSGDNGDGAGSNNVHMCTIRALYDYWYLRTCGSDGSQTDTSTTSAYDTNWHTFKSIQGASSVIMSVDGVTLATNTTNLPTGGGSPFAGMQSQNGGLASLSVKYMECYNT